MRKIKVLTMFLAAVLGAGGPTAVPAADAESSPTAPPPAATAQPLAPADPELLRAFATHLANKDQSAEDYVVSRFKEHDIVFLGERHLTKPRLEFLQRLIPMLYASGVYTLAYEMASREDQADVDRLLNGARYDEALAFGILARWDFYWPYQEYADVFRAAWALNHSLPAGAPRFRILAIDIRPDYRRLWPGMDPSSYESRGLIVGGNRDLVRNVRMADVLREDVIRRGIKALVYNGGGHSQTRYRRPNRYCPSGPRRMSVGYMIHAEIGDRAFSVMIVEPRPSGEDAVVDLLTASLPPGVQSGGFDTRGSPIGALQIKSGRDRIAVQDFYDGYAFIDLQRPWHAVTPNVRYITDERLRLAKETGLVPDDAAITVDSVKSDVLEAVARMERQLAESNP